MKYSNPNLPRTFRLKYTKVFCLKSIFIFLVASCSYGGTNSHSALDDSTKMIVPKQVRVGAENMLNLLELVKDKKVGIVANQTSMIGTTHLVDSLIASKVDILKGFSPEHGFRGDADAGEKVNSSVDAKTGLPLVSLYGKNKKPNETQLSGIEVMIFDLQDVGVRFYTYISTLHYVMEACGELGIPVIVLDRPNPNAHYIDGPLLETAQKSFIGMHPVPVVYGMTIGEYAQMINGEKWISTHCDLTVIPCEDYAHDTPYSLPVAPSPNLRTDNAIAWYPSLCFFEGTVVSVGRGTESPFEVAGHPTYKKGEFTFTPKSSYGAKDPLLKGELCRGIDFRDSVPPNQLHLAPLIDFYTELGSKPTFFLKNNFFDLLAGNTTLRKRIDQGWSEDQIRAEWQEGIEQFKPTRSKYLLY